MPPAGPHSVVLNSGSLRSLICTAAALSSNEPARVSLLHIRDGRPNAGVRREHFRRQADAYKITRLVELELPHIQTHHNTQGPPTQEVVLVRPQILMTGLAHTCETGGAKLIWPVQFNGDHLLISRTTEQVVVLQHLAQLERANLPAIEMPLLDLNDAQMIELGAQLNVPWELAWSCQLQADRPCTACPACRRRRHAFEAAGIVDPILKEGAAKG